jgi:aromatic-L-amino-acid decarboxylase
MTESSNDEQDGGKVPDHLGDMDLEDFRRYGYQVIDWISDYLSNPDRFPVLSQVKPGQIKGALPEAAPSEGEEMEGILADLDRIVLPGLTHWNHPSFFAYFAMNGSLPGILGDIVATGLNVNAMMWRTSPAATELEEVTLDWLRQLLGLPAEFSGVIYDTASMSSLCAIAAAREAVAGLRVREDGLGGRRLRSGEESVGPLHYPGYPFAGVDDCSKVESTNVDAPSSRLRLYVSEQAHSSIEKAAITLGIGQSGVRKIGTDSEYRMDAAALARAIEEDRDRGYTPFCVVATIGTTSTTSIDPVPEIAAICRNEGLWLHVDAAYGGSAAVVPEMRWVMAGCDHADSIVVNPHKWLFVPFDLSVLYCRRMEVLCQAFSLVPEYLRSANQDEVRNFMDYGPQLGRRFRALKLWFAIRYFGATGLAARLRRHIEMAREFARWVDASEDFERLAPVPFSTVCFRARPSRLSDAAPDNPLLEVHLDRLNEALLNEVNREGKIFLSHTKLDEKFTLRFAIGHIRTTPEHVKLAWEGLNAALKRLRE